MFAEANQRIKEQLIDLVKNGHDVQLHYHAQWHNATYSAEEDIFNLDLTSVDITSLDYKELVLILTEGKKFLEKLLVPIDEDYKCLAFRAGSWAVRDEKKLLNALKETGFKIDTSVVPNVKFNEGFINFEYANCPHTYHYWYIDEVLSKEGKHHTMLEIPIYTIKNIFSLPKYISLKSILLKILINKLYKNNISRYSMSFIQKLDSKLFRNYYMADINSMTAKTLIKMVEKVIHDDIFVDDGIIPIMMVGHSKASYGMEDMHYMYQYLLEKYGDNVKYWTLLETEKYLNGKNN